MLKDWYYFAWHNTGGTGACEGTPKYFIVILCVCRELVLSHCPELFQSAMFYLNNYDCKTCFVLSNITSWEKRRVISCVQVLFIVSISLPQQHIISRYKNVVYCLAQVT